MAENDKAGPEPRQDAPSADERRTERGEHPETLRLRAQALGATGFADR